MRNLLKKMLQPIRGLVQYLIKSDYEKNHSIIAPYKHNLVLRYEEHLLETSVDYAVKNFRQCLYFHFTPQIWDYTINLLRKQEPATGNKLILEFGTWEGNSINYLSALLPNRVFYGFDSFRGLQEDWVGFSLPAGHFDMKGNLPAVNKNVKLVVGWYNETLPKFLQTHKDELELLHIDCDTYESSKYVLDTLKERIKPGTYILFDEYIGYPNWEFGEYRAFQEFISINSLRYKYLAFSVKQVLVRIE